MIGQFDTLPIIEDKPAKLLFFIILAWIKAIAYWFNTEAATAIQ